MMTREELKEFKAEEVGLKLQQDLDLVKVKMSELSSIEDLKDAENKLMNEMAKYDDYLRSVKYELPSMIEFNGVALTKKDVSEKIVVLLNKIEVEFQYTLGLFELSNLWRNPQNITSLDYYKYDSTLRTLGQIRFKGYKEWNDILAVNQFFKGAHEEYTKDTAYNIYLAQIHNTILDCMKKVDEEPAVEIGYDDCEKCNGECKCEQEKKPKKKTTKK